MNVDVVLLPDHLRQSRLDGVTVVVFDVLRATTTMAAALAAGVREIRIYGSPLAARVGAVGDDTLLLCGEEKCLPPPGFHLGNSPGAFDATVHAGRTLCMSTTNGTGAILAADGAAQIFTGALVNASAVAHGLRRSGATDVILLCSGTAGELAAEDVIGAGAVLNALRPLGPVRLVSDAATMAQDLFLAHRDDLPRALSDTAGGRNVFAAKLDPDIAFAARLDAIDGVGRVHPGDPPVVRQFEQKNWPPMDTDFHR
jgi:2-phosphosulfolactate phosphatase